MSFVQGHCWISQHQLQPGGRPGHSNPSLSLMGLMTLAKSFNPNSLGPPFVGEQGSERGLDHLNRASRRITN